MSNYHVVLTGDRRLTLLEAQALLHFAERGWEVTKRELARGMPYGPPPLTDRASAAFVGAIEKVDEAFHEAKHRRDANETTPLEPFVVRALALGEVPQRRRGIQGAKPGTAYRRGKKR